MKETSSTSKSKISASMCKEHLPSKIFFVYNKQKQLRELTDKIVTAH